VVEKGKKGSRHLRALSWRRRQEKKLTASGGDGLGRIGEEARNKVTSVEERTRGKKQGEIERGFQKGFKTGWKQFKALVFFQNYFKSLQIL
jgi:hypothetical protein